MTTSSQTASDTRAYDYKIPFVIGASAIGTVIEWYDFYLYAVLAVFLAPIFFPGDPTAQLLSALATFGAGFAVRPFGAIVFGRIGDKTGRKVAFLLTVSIMGGATVLVGLLPGVCADRHPGTDHPGHPADAAGARPGRRVRRSGDLCRRARAGQEARLVHDRWIQTTATVGLFLALAVILFFRVTLGDAAFAEWGWRVPFLLSAVLVIGALYIRMRLQETPLFTQGQGAGKDIDSPLKRQPRKSAELEAHPPRPVRDDGGPGGGLVHGPVLRAGVHDRRRWAVGFVDAYTVDAHRDRAGDAVLHLLRLAVGPDRTQADHPRWLPACGDRLLPDLQRDARLRESDARNRSRDAGRRDRPGSEHPRAHGDGVPHDRARHDGVRADRRVPRRVLPGEDPLHVALAAVSPRERRVRRVAAASSPPPSSRPPLPAARWRGSEASPPAARCSPGSGIRSRSRS